MTDITLEQVIDWYLHVNNLSESVVFLGNKTPLSIKNNDFLLEFAKKLVNQVNAVHSENLDFRITMNETTPPLSFRVHIIQSFNGNIIALRKISTSLPNFDTLKIKPTIKEKLMSADLCSGGLVLFAGETGQGKTTTLFSTVVKRLTLFGGFCMSIEDPIENKLSCHIGKGYMLQMEVDPTIKDGYEPLLRGALRSYPAASGSILVIGEIRDASTAIHALKASVNGHLVLATIHANDAISALRRILSLAGHRDEHSEVLSSSLKMVIYQELKRGFIDAEILHSNSSISAVAAKIRKNKLELLADDICNQNRN